MKWVNITYGDSTGQHYPRKSRKSRQFQFMDFTKANYYCTNLHISIIKRAYPLPIIKLFLIFPMFQPWLRCVNYFSFFFFLAKFDKLREIVDPMRSSRI